MANHMPNVVYVWESISRVRVSIAIPAPENPAKKANRKNALLVIRYKIIDAEEKSHNEEEVQASNYHLNILLYKNPYHD